VNLLKKIPYNKLSENDKKNIIESYYNDLDLTFFEISEKLNISDRAISRVLKESNINTKILNRYKINNANYFENINTEFKAYVLGFIYADGFVGDNFDFALCLSDKHDDNYNLLKSFVDELDSTIEIKHGTSTSVNKSGIKNIHGIYALRFVCKEIYKDLIKLGVFPRKSLVINDIPNIPYELMNHFVRGYFDGDGSICSYLDTYDKRIRNNFEVLGTEKFLLKIQEILVKECDIKKTSLHKTHSEHITRIAYKGNKSIKKIREYLYKDATFYFKYKHDRFFNIQ
jgi:predicted DNA-binding protein YlxM (UPF0122 family)